MPIGATLCHHRWLAGSVRCRKRPGNRHNYLFLDSQRPLWQSHSHTCREWLRVWQPPQRLHSWRTWWSGGNQQTFLCRGMSLHSSQSLDPSLRLCWWHRALQHTCLRKRCIEAGWVELIASKIWTERSRNQHLLKMPQRLGANPITRSCAPCSSVRLSFVELPRKRVSNSQVKPVSLVERSSFWKGYVGSWIH